MFFTVGGYLIYFILTITCFFSINDCYKLTKTLSVPGLDFRGKIPVRSKVNKTYPGDTLEFTFVVEKDTIC